MALIINLRLSRQEEMLDHLRRKVNDSKKEAQGAKHRMGLFEALSQNRAQPLSVAQLVYELYKIIPETTALTNLQFIDGNLTIQGQSRESADVNVIQKALLDSPLFTDVTLQYANRPQRLAMEYTEFRIVCRVLHKGETRP
jgi:Tfp pilus assembly protein PilN